MAAQDPKRLKILLGVLGTVVVAALAYTLFFSGGGGDDTATTTTTTERTSGPNTDPNGSGDPGTDVPPDTGSDDTDSDDTFDVFATKNPFEPLVNVGGTPTDPTTLTTPTDPTTPTTPTDPTTPTTPTTPGTSGGGGGGGGVEPVAPENVALLDVFVEAGVRSARVRVGSTVYTVTVGEVFATSYQVVSLDDACGQFLFGDDAFQLCQGEEVIK